jgi:hypothetical protein
MRKLNPGIRYYPKESGHTKNKRVRLLINDYGSDGYWIWCCLLDYAYEVNGYYFDATGEDFEFIASEICRKPPELIWKVVESCLKRGLFDRELYNKHKILSNDRMQVNYIRGTYERRRKGSRILILSNHLIIPQSVLVDMGEKLLVNFCYLEDLQPVWQKIHPSAENTLFPSPQPEESDISAELSHSSAEFSESSMLEEKEKRREFNTVAKATSPTGDLPKKKLGVVGIVNKSKPGAGDLVENTGRKKTARAKKNSGPDEKLFNHIKNFWLVWFKSRGNPSPKFEGKEAKAVASLRTYMLRLSREKNYQDVYEGAEKEFDFILDNWEKLKPSDYLYTSVDISQINSKINEILNFFNNGHTTKKAQGRTGNSKGGGHDTNAVYDKI